MAYLLRLTPWLIAAWAALGCTLSALAQQPAAPAEIDLSVPELSQPDEPGVAAILATRPTTPAEKVRAAKILASFERYDLARQFLAQVVAANLDQAQLTALLERFGPPLFVQMATRVELAPEGKQLADAVLAAAEAVKRDTARLDALVGQLSSSDRTASLAAMEDLLDAGSASLPPLVAALADPARSNEHDAIRSALVRFGTPAAEPLMAALESGSPQTRAQALQALGSLRPLEAAPFFLAAAVDPEEDAEVRGLAQRGLELLGRKAPGPAVAAAMLADEARHFADGRKRLREDLDGNVTVWTWDGATNRPAAKLVPVRQAQVALAARLSARAHHLAPEDEQTGLLAMATALETASLEAGLDAPLAVEDGSAAGIVAAAGLEKVEQVLTYAMEHDLIGAAIAAVRILAERGSVLEQLCASATGSPLIQAVRHDDRRLRFAALEAVVALDPRTPFAGSGSVADATCFFASSQGRRRALIAGPSTSESQRVAGYLAALGYSVETARTGRELIGLALRSADYELVLVDQGIQAPPVDLLLQQLRHDNRTSRLPVGILARDGQFSRAEHAARNDPLAAAFSRPHSQDVVAWQVERVLELATDVRVEAPERLTQGSTAMQWLADWSGGHGVFRLPRKIDAVYEALFHPALVVEATEILANTGTPEAQKALIDLASRWTQPLERRKAAVEALWDNTSRHGILLTSGEILLQYDRFNRSESLDPASQQVLASILDCLEAPSKVARELESDLEEAP